MEQKKIDRINELARKSRTDGGLTPEEKKEQETLRREYIDSYKSSLTQQLENTYILDVNGNKQKVQRRSGTTQKQ